MLLTRAVEDAARTRATLEALGHNVLVSPVIAIRATDADWPGGVVDGVLATSAHAFATLTSKWGPSPEARRLLPLWLVGQRTKHSAYGQGFAGPANVQSNAVALAYEIDRRRARGRLVYLAGRDRKRDIEAALSVAAHTVQIIEMYEAVKATGLNKQVAKALAIGTIDAVLHFSRRSAAIYLDLAVDASIEKQPLHICLSNDVAVPLGKAGWPTLIADKPTEMSMISALQTHDFT